MSTQPTDAEIIAVAATEGVRVRTGAAAIKFARAVLAKWGQPSGAGEPVAWLRNTTDPQPHAVTNLKYRSAADVEAGVEYIPVFAAPQPVEREPLDEARRLFDAGWKAAALFCDREDVVADGIIGFGACPQFEAAFSAAQPVAREPQCWCLTCRPMRFEDPYSIRMALCPTCGNKRCPKANDHRNTCAGSNEPGSTYFGGIKGDPHVG